MSALAGGVTLALGAFILITALSIERVPTGVRVGQYDIGGSSAEGAANILNMRYGAPLFTARDATAEPAPREWSLSAAQIGARLDIDAVIDAALEAAPNSAIAPIYAVDLVQAQAGLLAFSEQTNIEPVDGEYGRALEIPVLLDRLRADPTGELADGVIDLPMMVIAPPPPQFSDAVNVSETARTTHVVTAGQELGLIARAYGVTIDDILALNAIPDPNLIYVGQALLIPAAGVYTPDAAQAPPAPTTVGKAILVSTTEQRIYAYENGQLLRSHLVSTGRSETPTVLGDYTIYVKYEADDMRGADYFLPAVPYTMYFYQGYAIHGTYWHSAFGRPMSHGCVNLPVSEAQWFFNWADTSTLVRVI
jgi:lipoprotein-anchoring transpeptidase ErfK/SrfK